MADSTTPESQTPATTSQAPAASQAILQAHSNAIVPHAVADYDTNMVQLNVWTGTKWVNIFDGNDFTNTQADLHRVAKVVETHTSEIQDATKTASDAVKAVDSAVSASKVNSDAIVAQSSAISEVKAATDSAMSRAESAWDVATGAKEAVTDFDPLIKSAQSDASKALTQIADTASALSDAKTVFNSDVAEAKELANTAQTTANSAVESAGENAKALASQANALSDAKKAVDGDIASAKGLANAAQATADNAVKSASSVASDLAAVASQAKSNASGITKVTSDVGLLQTTVADNSGNISKIQETAKQIQQAVSDNAGNITTAKQTADSAVAVASDAKSNATVAVQTASGASVTAKNAQGDATTAITTANGAVTQASDAKSSATIAVQTASEASLTAANAKGDASVAKQTASDASVQIKNAQGDISALQTRAGKIEASVTTNSGAIADVQATANQLKASVSDNAGNITTAKQTADSAVTVASDARSNATVAIQTASQASITANNASGQAASAVLTANGAMTTASDAKSDATVAVQTASGASLTATNANSDATIAKQTASEATVQASNANSDFAQLSIRANKIEANVATNSGAITSVQQTANGLTTTVADIKANGGGVNLLTGTSGDLQTKQFTNSWNSGPQATNGNYKIKLVKGQTYTYRVWIDNTNGQVPAFVNIRFTPIGGTDFNLGSGTPIDSGKTGYSTLLITPSEDGYAWFTPFAYSSPQTFLAKWKEEMLEEGTVAHTWSPAPDDLQNQFTQIKQSIDGVTTTINDPKTGLNATYQTAAGNATTISSVKGDVTQLQTTANGLTSRVGSLESKTNTQQTAIEQNKKDITLKADQTTVNTLEGTVSQNSATLTTQANQIQSKVSASDVTGMLNGYATTSTVQSLVTQKADQWNLNLTSLQTDVNAIKATGGGVNLVQNTSTDIVVDATNSTTNNWAFATIFLDKQPKQGDLITISAEGTLTGTGTLDEYQVILYDRITTKPRSQSKFLKAGQRDSVTLSLDNLNGSGDTVLLIYAGKAGDTAGKKNVVHHLMVEEGTVAHTWSPAPSDMATVTSVTNLSATVDGIQGQVYNSDGSSKITQLSNAIQTKVGTDDFNNLKQAVGLQTLESADINNMKTNGHYFVHNLANNPIGGWVYVDVTGDGSSRIRQDVYQDNGSQHKYRRWVDTNWTGWEEGATYTEINQLRSDINLRVTKGDLLSQINLEAGNTLIQSNKIYLDADSVVFGENSTAFIPSAYITDINADKITSGTLDAGNVQIINLTADHIKGGTLDAGNVQIINLTADHIKGGTLDVGNMNIRNFSANDIEAGTLSGVTIRAGDTTDFFQTSKDNIYWITDNGDQSALLGKGTYTDFPGFNIFDSQAISLGTYAGSYLQNGTIEDNGGSIGHPQFNIERPADSAFNLLSKNGERTAPLDNSRISGWVGPNEFFSLEQNNGFYVRLNQDNNASEFDIQKDGCIGAYFGVGSNGNQITLVTGSNGQPGTGGASINVMSDFHVTGTKNSIVNTKQGYLAINAYETAEYYFGDIGESNTGEACQVTIGIDQIFNETVNTDIAYQVFVTPYSDAHVWVKDRYNNRFVVCSDKPNAEFGWELKAKRKGYESDRLRHVNVDVNPLQLKGDAK